GNAIAQGRDARAPRIEQLEAGAAGRRQHIRYARLVRGDDRRAHRESRGTTRSGRIQARRRFRPGPARDRERRLVAGVAEGAAHVQIASDLTDRADVAVDAGTEPAPMLAIPAHDSPRAGNEAIDARVTRDHELVAVTAERQRLAVLEAHRDPCGSVPVHDGIVARVLVVADHSRRIEVAAEALEIAHLALDARTDREPPLPVPCHDAR